MDEHGGPDIGKARPLLMTGTKNGMRYGTLKSLGREDPFSAIFPDGKEPVQKMQGRIRVHRAWVSAFHPAFDLVRNVLAG